jgi:hypothetical protein
LEEERERESVSVVNFRLAVGLGIDKMDIVFLGIAEDEDVLKVGLEDCAVLGCGCGSTSGWCCDAEVLVSVEVGGGELVGVAAIAVDEDEEEVCEASGEN